MYKTRMPAATSFLESLHCVPEPGWTGSAFSVIRAGKVAAGPDYSVERLNHPGQDILYCLSGAGVVETLGQRLSVQPGQLLWIANEAPHAHFADPRSPWTVLWFRLEGPNPPALRKRLFGDAAPRVTVIEGGALTTWFDRLFSAIRGREPGLDLRLNQLIGEFLIIVDQSVTRSSAPGMPKALAAIVAAMRVDLRSTMERSRAKYAHTPQPLADAPAVSQTFAGKSSPMAAARTSHICSIAHCSKQCTAFRDRRSVRLLRRLSFQPGIQARHRNLAGRLAPRRIRDRP